MKKRFSGPQIVAKLRQERENAYSAWSWSYNCCYTVFVGENCAINNSLILRSGQKKLDH